MKKNIYLKSSTKQSTLISGMNFLQFIPNSKAKTSKFLTPNGCIDLLPAFSHQPNIKKSSHRHMQTMLVILSHSNTAQDHKR